MNYKHLDTSDSFLGIVHFEVSITQANNSKTDIRDDMEKLVKSLVDENEQILIKGFSDYVEQITPDEEKVYENIKDYDPDEIR